MDGLFQQEDWTTFFAVCAGPRRMVGQHFIDGTAQGGGRQCADGASPARAPRHQPVDQQQGHLVGVALRGWELHIGGDGIGIDGDDTLRPFLQFKSGFGHPVPQPSPTRRMRQVVLFGRAEIFEQCHRVVENAAGQAVTGPQQSLLIGDGPRVTNRLAVTRLGQESPGGFYGTEGVVETTRGVGASHKTVKARCVGGENGIPVFILEERVD